MHASLVDVAIGIDAQAKTNAASQLLTGLSVISLISAFLPLQKAESDQLNLDAEKIFQAQMASAGKPGGAAAVASVVEQRNIDSTTSDIETGKLNSIIEQQKGAAQIEGNILTGTVDLEQPIIALLRAQVEAIQTPM